MKIFKKDTEAPVDVEYNPPESDQNTEILELMNGNTVDKFDLFGDNVACKLRSIRNTNAQNTVERLIDNILDKGMTGGYDDGPVANDNLYPLPYDFMALFDDIHDALEQTPQIIEFSDY